SDGERGRSLIRGRMLTLLALLPLDFPQACYPYNYYTQRQQLGPAFPPCSRPPRGGGTRGVEFSLLPCGAFFLVPLFTCHTFLFQRLEMCQQSSEEGFCFRLFLVVHSPFQVRDASLGQRARQRSAQQADRPM